MKKFHQSTILAAGLLLAAMPQQAWGRGRLTAEQLAGAASAGALPQAASQFAPYVHGEPGTLPRFVANRPQMAQANAPTSANDDDDGLTRLRGSVIYASSWDDQGTQWGVYRITTDGQRSIQVDPIHLDYYLYAAAGVFYDDVFHFTDRDYFSAYYSEWDTTNWTSLLRESLYESDKGLDRRDLCASDCDYDFTTGLTYGAYYNPELNAYEFCAVNHDTRERRALCRLNCNTWAIAVNAEGTVYGIRQSDGCLYRFDKTTGAQTRIGSTGVNVGNYINSACFDRATNTLWWAATTDLGAAFLAKVDVNTGKATRIGYFTDGQQVTCLNVEEATPGEEPAAVGDLAVGRDTPEGTSVTVSFTLPLTDGRGNPLDCDLNYSLKLNGAKAKQGSGQPGMAVTHQCTVDEGLNVFAVACSNAMGTSPLATDKQWYGYDTPRAVGNLQAHLHDATTVELTWDTPAEGIHGGYVDPEGTTYRVVRQPGETVVATDLRANTLTDEIPSAGTFFYEVTPTNHGLQGEKAASNNVTVDGVFVPPYSEDFHSQDAFNQWTVVNVNGGKTWYWRENLCCALYSYDEQLPADDWLISPEIRLEPGKLYKLSFNYCASGLDPHESLRVLFGTGDDYAAMPEILNCPDLNVIDYQTFSMPYTVDVPSLYRFAFHAGSYAASYCGIKIDNVAIDVEAQTTAPGPCTGLTLTAGERGALQATIAFRAPALNAANGPLESLDNIQLLRGDKLINTFLSPTPGEQLTFTDTEARQGENSYTLVAYNASGAGLPATGSVFVGLDEPKSPTNLRVTDNLSAVLLQWDAPGEVGANGHYVDPAALTYNIYASNGVGQWVVTQGVDATEYSVVGELLTGQQQMVQFMVTASSAVAESLTALSEPLIVGDAYRLPFRESFPGADAPATFWWTGGYNTFQPTADHVYDSDGGSVAWQNDTYNNYTWLNSGKISLSGAADPVVTFATLSILGHDMKLSVYVSTPGHSDELVGVVDYAVMDSTEANDWRQWSFSLAPFLTDPYVVLKFYATSDDPCVPLYLDQVTVREQNANDLALAAFRTPRRLRQGQTVTITAAVENQGYEPAAAFTLNLRAGTQTLPPVEGPALQPGQRALLDFEFTPSPARCDFIVFEGTVDFADDLNDDNNTLRSNPVEVLRPDYPTVADLTATRTAQGTVALNWSRPLQNPHFVEESFENYIHKDTVLTDGWQTLDRDLGLIFTNQLLDLGYHNEPMSYMVFNPYAAMTIPDDMPYYLPQDGDQCLLSMHVQEQTIPAATGCEGSDDWLISPEFAGDQPQTISFWAKAAKGEKYGLEAIEVLASSSFDAVEDFTLVAADSVPAQWTHFEVPLPAGATRFAVRRVSNAYILLFDNFRFFSGEMAVKGYDIYRDGELVGTVDLPNDGDGDQPAAATFTDTSVSEGANHVYNVVVSYSNGLSAFSNDALLGASGLTDPACDPADDIFANGPIDIYAIDGRLVRPDATTLRGLPSGFYMAGSRKLFVK